MNTKPWLKKMMSFSALSWIQAALSFLLIPINTRLYDAAQLGKLGMFYSALNIFVTLSSLCCEQSYIRFFAQMTDTSQRALLRVRCILISLTSFCCVMALLLIFGRHMSFLLFDGYELHIVYVCLPLTVLCAVLQSYRSAYFRMNEKALGYTLCGLIPIMALKLSTPIAAIIKADMRTAVTVSTVIYAALTVALLFVRYERVDPSDLYDRRSFAEILKYAFPFIPSALVTYAGSAAVGYILKESLDYNSLGIYNTALSVSNVLTVIQSGFAVYWPAFMYKHWNTRRDFIKKIHSAVTFLMSLICLFLMLFSGILFMIIGKGYREGVTVFGLLLLSPLVYMVGETVCYGIYLSKKTYWLIYFTIADLVASVAIAAFLIPKFGLLGAAVSNVAASSVFFAFRYALGQHYYKSTEKVYRTFISMLLVVGGGIVNYVFASQTVAKNTILCLLISALCLMYVKELTMLVNRTRSFIKDVLERRK